METIRANFLALDFENKGYVTISDISRGMNQGNIDMEQKNPMFRKILSQASRLDKVDFEQFLSILEMSRM